MHRHRALATRKADRDSFAEDGRGGAHRHRALAEAVARHVVEQQRVGGADGLGRVGLAALGVDEVGDLPFAEAAQEFVERPRLVGVAPGQDQ